MKSRVLNSQRKKYPSPIKKSAKRRAMTLATTGSKLVQNEPNQPGFYTRLPARLRVLLMRQHGKSYRRIARQVGIDKATVQKIVHSAPEKEPVEKIFKDAEILRFARVAGQALEALHMRLRQNDGKVALAVLRGLGFLKP